MKGCSLFNAKYYLCNRNSERSLVIQNNELSRISLISKSLPIQPVFNRRVFCFKHLAQYHIFTMEYFIITESTWTKLRNEILSLAETCHKAFGEQSEHTDWLHNGDVCKLLNISKRTLQHYRDMGVLPFAQIGHKCYYKREDVEQLLQTKSDKSKNGKINT